MKMNYRYEKVGNIVHKLFVLVLAIGCSIFCAAPLQAHNLWVVGDANKNGDGTVHLYFEHWVGPGDGAYNGPIIERGKTWVRTLQGESNSVPMKEVVDNDKKYLVGNGGKASGSYAIDHSSLYGIYHGQLDFFHGRYIEAKDVKDLETLAESPHLPVQIIPVWTEKGLVLRVLYFAVPQAKASIWIIKSDNTEESFIADNKGEFLFGAVKPGIYHILTRIVEKEPAGAFEYEAYKGVMHGSTLTLKLLSGFGQ